MYIPASSYVQYIDGISLKELYTEVVPRNNVMHHVNTLLPNQTIILIKI